MPTAPVVILAALLGLLAGTSARRAALVLAVPTDQARRTGCPACAAPFTATSAKTALGRCPACGQRIGAPALLPELATAALWGLSVAAAGTTFLAAALCWLAVCAVALSLVDWAVHRLPDPLTLATGAGLAVLLSAAALADSDGTRLLRAAEAAAALGLCYLLLALFTSLGLGDVKLAPSLGAALGWFGWPYLLVGVFTGFLLASLYGAFLLTSRRATRHSKIAYGPFMALGALAVCLLAS